MSCKLIICQQIVLKKIPLYATKEFFRIQLNDKIVTGRYIDHPIDKTHLYAKQMKTKCCVGTDMCQHILQAIFNIN